jgi:type I restriction enzyme S subunit
MAFNTPIAELIERNSNGLLGKLPRWERVRLGDVVTVQNGAAFKSEYFNTEGLGMPLLRIRDITPGATETWYDGPFEDEYIVQPGELVIGMDGEFNHALWAGSPALLNQRVCRLVFRNDVLRKAWVFYALGGYLQAVNEATPSVTVKHLSSKTVADLLLPFPPSSEQDRIIEVLDSAFSNIANGEQSFMKALGGAEALKASVLAEMRPASAPTVRIGEVADVYVGATPSRKKPELWGGDIPWVASGEVAFCRITSARETITRAGLGNAATRLHPPGTVLLAMIGEGKTRGQAAILDVAAAHNQNAASIRLDPARMLPEYLFYCLMGLYERNRLAAGGSQQPALNGELVRAIELPCPPTEQQRELVAQTEEQLRQCAALERTLSVQLRQSKSLQASLLCAAISGQLAPVAPNDPPADSLLGQANVERSAHEAKPSRRTSRAALVEGRS